MNRVNNNIKIWVFIYRLLSVNTLAALSAPILLGMYSYYFIIPNSIFGSICAFSQITLHSINKKYPVPFYKQSLSLFVATFLYLVLFEAVVPINTLTIQIFAVLLFVSTMITIPLLLVAYFIRIRVLKYDTKLNK